MSFGVLGSMDIARDVYRGYCDYYYNGKICVQIGLLIFVDFFGEINVGDGCWRHLTLNVFVQCSNVRSCSVNIRTREHGFMKKIQEHSNIEHPNIQILPNK